MGKTTFAMIYGTDAADIYHYCAHHGGINPIPQAVLDFIEQYEVVSVPEPIFKRRHLPRLAKALLSSIVGWKFGFKTFNMPMPSLSYWCERLVISQKDIWRITRGLLQQGLLCLPENHRQGRALRFTVEALLAKAREWLHLRAAAFDAAELPAEECVPEVEIEADLVEEPQPEPTNIAAFAPAPEWDMAAQGIAREIGPSAAMNLSGIRAYWMNGTLNIRTRDRSQWDWLMQRCRRVLNRHLAEYNFIVTWPARSSA